MESMNSGCVLDTISAWSIFANDTVGGDYVIKRLYVTGDLTFPVVWFAITKLPTSAGAIRSTVHLAGSTAVALLACVISHTSNIISNTGNI